MNPVNINNNDSTHSRQQLNIISWVLRATYLTERDFIYALAHRWHFSSSKRNKFKYLQNHSEPKW